MNNYYYLIAVFGTLIESISDIAFKTFVTTNENVYLLAGVVGYILTGLTFMNLLYIHNLATSNIIWHVIHFTILSLFSIFYFKETYTHQDIIGIGFGLISFILLSHRHNH